MANKPLNYVSLKTRNKFSYEEYSNHGYGGLKCGFVPGLGTICFNDLPAEEYPYTIEYQPAPIPKWDQQ